MYNILSIPLIGENGNYGVRVVETVNFRIWRIWSGYSNVGIRLIGKKKSTNLIPLRRRIFTVTSPANRGSCGILHWIWMKILYLLYGILLKILNMHDGKFIFMILYIYDRIVDVFNKCYVNKKKYTYHDMVIETDESLGDVEVVILGIISWRKSRNEYVDFTKVYDFAKNRAETEFPCYHWIEAATDGVSTTSSTSKQTEEG